jgi:multiple sugar transport system substrate-binding protein
MKKIVAMLLVLTMVCGMLVGCASKTDKSSDSTDPAATTAPNTTNESKEPVNNAKEDTITLMVPPVSGTYLEKVKVWADEFHQKYPNLTIEIIETSWDDHNEKLSTMALAGEAPDIAEVSYSSIGTYVELGVGVNIADYMDQAVLADYDQNALDYMTLEGKIYGLPLYLSIQSIGANKDMLEAAGVNVADVQQNGWSFDEFKKAIAAGTKDGCYGFVFATSAVTASDLLNIFGVSAGINNAFTKDLKYAYTSENVLKFLKEIEEMTASGYMPNYGVDASQRMVMCQTGNAMIFGKAMPLFEGNINKNNKALEAKDGTAVENSIPVNYAFLPIPTMEGVTESCYGTVDGLMAFRNNKTTDEHLANVMLALNYLSSGDVAAYVSSELYLDSVCESGRAVMDKYLVEGRDENNLQSASRAMSLVVAPPTGMTAEMSSKAATLMEQTIAPKLQALLAGEVSAQEMYDEICKAAFDQFGEENCEKGPIK